jgi:hypothetical protein
VHDTRLRCCVGSRRRLDPTGVAVRDKALLQPRNGITRVVEKVCLGREYEVSGSNLVVAQSRAGAESCTEREEVKP